MVEADKNANDCGDAGDTDDDACDRYSKRRPTELSGGWRVGESPVSSSGCNFNNNSDKIKTYKLRLNSEDESAICYLTSRYRYGVSLGKPSPQKCAYQ